MPATAKDFLEPLFRRASGSGVFLPVGHQARDGDGKDDLHVFIEDFVENPIICVASEEDNTTLIAASFQVR